MSSFIIDKIKKTIEQKITYATYMEWALYDPVHGYYMKDRTKIGKQGDFYTTSQVHPIFAKLFAKLFLELFDKEKLPLNICEFGAGTGQFAKDLLDELQKLSPDLFHDITYIIVETSPYHRDVQKQLLDSYPNVKIFTDFQFLKTKYDCFEGIVFSNEFFDAFPVHVIEQDKHGINEIFVTAKKDQLVEQSSPCENEQILLWLKQYGPQLNIGQRIEIPLAMTEWLKDFSTWFNRGIVFTIDYAYSEEDWSQPERFAGSLRGFYQHQLITNPLLHPGEMDLTAHIHLDAFIKIGEEAGLTTFFRKNQDRFLLQAGILNYLQNNYDPNPFSEISKQNRAIRSLITDGSMSRAFHVIVQGKNITNWQDYSFIKNQPFF